jgi:hypothetical protein
MSKTEYSRKCPRCNTNLFYATIYTFNRAERNSNWCIKCIQIGKRHSDETKRKIGIFHKNKELSEEQRVKISLSQLGKRHNAATIQKISDSHKGNKNPNFGKHLSEEHRIKISNSHVGQNNHFYNKKHSEETLEKLRVIKLKRIKQLYGNGMYNPLACKFINNLNKIMGIKLQHAENGGERWIGGYSVDGYDEQNNIVFEYDEPKHNSPNHQRKDAIRQQNIINKIHPTLFLRYNEMHRRLYDTDSKSIVQVY